MKLTRKVKFCMSSDPSAGAKAQAEGQCPPELTYRVKKALKEEIKNFDAKQAQKEMEESATGGPYIDAYQEWLDQHRGQELPEANPDIVCDEDGFKYIASKKIKNNEIVRLLEEFRQSLTKRELQVWNLVMHKQYSHRLTADILKIKPRLIAVYLKRSKAKLVRFAEAMKNVEKD